MFGRSSAGSAAMAAGSFQPIWAPVPLEEAHVFLHRPPSQDLYKKFMFKKTMIIVGCLLAMVMLIAHWSTVARCILFMLQRRAKDDEFSEESVVLETFKPERDADSKPLRAIHMVKFTKKAALDKMGSECMICLGEFRKSEKIGRLPDCGHGFHRPCIEMWLFGHPNCPICRRSLMQDAV